MRGYHLATPPILPLFVALILVCNLLSQTLTWYVRKNKLRTTTFVEAKNKTKQNIWQGSGFLGVEFP